MKILNTLIDLESPTYFIADIAANHDGDLERALHLIELAANAGADCVKFQHHTAERVASDKGYRQLGDKLGHQAKWKKSVYQVYKEAEVSKSWTPILAEHAASCGVHFMSTPYSFEMVDHIDPYVPAYKIGSGDVNWHMLLEKICSKQKPVILSTGASTLEEVQKSYNVLLSNGIQKEDICIMQCNTNYTGQEKNYDFINLNVLRTFRNSFPDSILGLSDHTHGHVTTLGSVAFGAKIVEKHFTDDNDRIGPDHSFSMNPITWRQMVDDTRILERSFGSEIKVVEDNEKQTVVVQRRSVRCLKDIDINDIIELEHFDFQRPCPSDACDLNEFYEFMKHNKVACPFSIKVGDHVTKEMLEKLKDE